MPPSSLRRSGPEPLQKPPSEIDPQHHQQAIERNPSPPALPAHTLFAKSRHTPLLNITDPYISPDYMRDFRIRWCLFDMNSGASFDPSTHKLDQSCRSYTRPFPLKDMIRAVNTNRPWISPEYNTPGFLTWDDELDNWWHGYRIGEHLDMYLGTHYTGRKPGLIRGTNWQAMGVPSRYKLNHQNNVVKWSVMHLWQRKSAEPHVVCVLTDRVPLHAERISVPEMRTVLTLSGMRARDEGHHHHKVIPVTIISTAGKKLRVVVGIVDSMNRSVEVRTGQIIDFADGLESVGKNWEPWMKVLSWMMGQPIGATD